MATIDIELVTRPLQAIKSTSRVVAKLLYECLEAIETEPAQFDELDEVRPSTAALFRQATFRKAYIEHGKHSFRLVFVHWTFSPDDEHVDVIYAFPRKRGYPIDWDWIEQLPHPR
jgi:hypothetical protein